MKMVLRLTKTEEAKGAANTAASFARNGFAGENLCTRQEAVETLRAAGIRFEELG